MSRKRLVVAVSVLVFAVPLLSYGAMMLTQAFPPTIKWEKDEVQSLNLKSNVSLQFKGGEAGETYKLVVRQDATGGRKITWPSEVLWPGGSAPVLTATPNAVDVMEFLFDGSKYLGSFRLNYAGSPPPPPPNTLTTGLLHYWKLDEASGDAVDSVGSMTLTNNNLTIFSSGKINKGAEFHKVNTNYFKSTTNIAVSPLTAYSVCMWFKPASVPDNGAAYNIWTSYTASGELDLQYVNFGDGRIGLQFRHFSDQPSDQPAELFYNTTLTNGTFYYVCGTWNGLIRTLYLNGVQVGSQLPASSIAFNLSGNATVLGAQINAGNLFDGMIDETGFWTRALSAAEISQLYNNGSGIQYPF